jgi:hypothetical protein
MGGMTMRTDQPMTYTVLRGDGEVIARGLSASDAATEIMTYDGCEIELRRDEDGGYTLWSRQQVANRPWATTRFWSWNTDEDAAWEEIAGKVLATEWPSNYPDAMTDQQYDEMVAQAED